MLKMRVPAFADIQSLKLFFTQEKIQKLKRIGRQVIASSVIVSILGVDMVYAMEDGELGPRTRYISFNGLDETKDGAPHNRTHYVGFNDSDETDNGETKESVSFTEGQGLQPQIKQEIIRRLEESEINYRHREGRGPLPDSLVNSTSSEDGETMEEGQGSPTSSPTDLSFSTNSEESKSSSGGSSSPGSSRSSSPTGDESMDLGEDESGEGPRLLRNLPRDTEIELANMSRTRLPRDGETLIEEGRISLQ